MKLTPGILKSIESGAVISLTDKQTFFIIKYNGKNFQFDGKLIINSETKAKSKIIDFIRYIFTQGQILQGSKNWILEKYKYEVDFTETIKILPSFGLTSRFELPENKKMFKDIAENCLKEKIFEIVKIEI